MHRLLLPLLVLLVLAAPASATITVDSRTVSIGAGSPTSTARLANGTASACGADMPASTATAGTRRYERFFLTKYIEEDACLTTTVTGAGCTLWTGAWHTFVTSNITQGMQGRPASQGVASATFSYDVGSTPGIVVGTAAADGTCASAQVTTTSDRPWATNRPSLAPTAPQAGSSVTTNNGAWSDAVTVQQRGWRLCDSVDPDDCTPLAGVSSSSFIPGPSLEGKRLRSVIKVEADGESSTIVSRPTAPIVVPRPRETYAVTKSSGAVAETGGLILAGSDTADDGLWKVDLPIAVRLGGEPTTKLHVSANGLIAAHATPGDEESLAENGPDCLAAFDLPAAPVLAALWQDLDATGAPGQGVFVSFDAAAQSVKVRWSSALHDNPTIAVRFSAELFADGRVVLRYPAAGIGAADGASIGLQVRVLPDLVTSIACDEQGVVDGDQLTIAPRRPAVVGTAALGATLTTQLVPAAGASLVSAQTWLRCDAGGGSCGPTGATNGTYAVTGADAGHTLRARQIASNAFGALTLDSAPTAVVAPAAALPTPDGGNPGTTPTTPPPSGTGPTPPARDRTAPKVTKVSVKRSGRRATATVTLSEPGTVKLTLVRGRKTVLARAVRSTGTTARLRFALTKTAKLTVVATDAAGNRSPPVRRTLTVRRRA